MVNFTKIIPVIPSYLEHCLGIKTSADWKFDMILIDESEESIYLLLNFCYIRKSSADCWECCSSGLMLLHICQMVSYFLSFPSKFLIQNL